MRARFVLAALFCAVWGRAQDLTFYPVDETDKTPSSELMSRRNAVREALGADTIGVFFTNPERNRNNDVDFRFRGDSSFLYLTGFEEPSAALILIPGGATVDGRRVKEILFVNEPDIASITWLGYRMGPANAEKLLGVEMALPNKRFNEVSTALLKPGVKVSIGQIPPAPSGAMKNWSTHVTETRDGQKLESGPRIGAKLNAMRAVKSPYEIAIMKKVCDISARAHVEAIKAIKPGMREYEIMALVEYIYAKNGCEYVGYPSICGSGPNSTILHYNSNRRLMKDGEVFLMDSAGEYHGYTADVTRTFPVNGKFTAEQRAIYEVVYAGQQVGISMCRDGATMSAISNAISDKMAEKMIALGIIQNRAELGRYYMHGFGHGLGLDVHDPLPGTLAAGMCLTVEPGIYIKAGSPCDKKWWNIGIRIEDDILVTAGEPVNMSAAAPRTWQEIEKLMAR